MGSILEACLSPWNPGLEQMGRMPLPELPQPLRAGFEFVRNVLAQVHSPFVLLGIGFVVWVLLEAVIGMTKSPRTLRRRLRQSNRSPYSAPQYSVTG